MTCRVLAELGASGLHHPAEPVRKVAERVLVQVYRVNPRLVRKQLPPDDDITRRNLLYRHLMTEFDKIDLERKQEVCDRGKLVRSGSISSSQPSSRAPEALHISFYSCSRGTYVMTTPLVLVRRQCIFCLRTSDSFTEEGLNIHYWKYCPMLTRCIHCQEVVEVSGLASHLVADCDLRHVYSRCHNCGDAVETDLSERHLALCPGKYSGAYAML
ncbi:hypothetical protein AAG570_007073 [Ranatra chinensis]|uniref:Centrosomal protein CEP104 Zn finger domain-containing protein n=1 Tax=Ranatra chinensis TaxID=642074 RepID=A0ABD0XUT7_9HEMI